MNNGTATVNTIYVKTNSIILLTVQENVIGTGAVFVSSRIAGVSFTIIGSSQKMINKNVSCETCFL